MKKLPMLLLLTAPYLLLGCLLWRDSNAFALAGIVYFAVSLLISMVYPFFMPRLWFSVRELLLWSMVLKLSAIPFYVLVFLTALLLNIMIIPCSRYEISALIDILGLCGVLSTAEHPCPDEEFRGYAGIDPPESRNDFAYPVCHWQASDGVNETRLRKVFGCCKDNSSPKII